MGAFLKFFLGILLLIILAFIASYAFVKLSAKPLNDEARAKAPGSFIALSAGQIHYRWHGPENGAVIIMSHGFSTPNFIFEQNAAALAADGFRVLTYDHFGRGWSDRPRVKYDVDFYDQELLDLTDALGLHEPFGLVGLSMGGPITAEFTARHPERVAKLFLFVPAGFVLGAEPGSASDKLLRTKLVGDMVWRLIGKRILLGDPQYNEADIDPQNRLAGDVSEQMQYAGYFEALLSSYHHLPMHDRDATYARAEAQNIPVHAVFGTDDQTVLIASADRLAKAMPSAQITRLEGGEHGLNYQMNSVTNPMLVNFFSSLKKADPQQELIETPREN